MEKPIEEIQRPKDGYTGAFVLNNSDIDESARKKIWEYREAGMLQFAPGGIDVDTTTVITSKEVITDIKSKRS